MTRAFVGMGSNQGDPMHLFDAALDALRRLEATRLMAESPRYWTDPVGDTGQPEFLNGVAELETALDAHALLDGLQRIELAEGRTRDAARPWGPRTLDLDLLLFGHEIIHSETLTVPHPRMASRAFVLVPLADLAPELRVPGLGRLADLVAATGRRGVRPARPEVML